MPVEMAESERKAEGTERVPIRLEPPELGRMYEDHSRYVYYLALRFLGNAEQAEDVTHDVFLKAYRHLGQFRGQSTLRTWLYRITINSCQNLRQRWASRNVLSNADESVWAGAAANGPSPLRVLEMKELGERIQRALEQLPEEYRLPLLLLADAEMSYEAIARLTDQSADAVRGKLYRARKAFAAAFAQTA